MHHWYALYTKPKAEQQVDTILQLRGLDTYLPLIKVPKKGAPSQRVLKPFFPCYLFAYLDLAVVSVSSINWTPGMRSIVSFCGEPAIVDDAIIETIRLRLDAINEGRPLGEWRFKQGDRVRIKDGVLEGLEAIFDETVSASGRVRILLNILSRQAVCEIEADRLEKVL